MPESIPLPQNDQAQRLSVSKSHLKVISRPLRLSKRVVAGAARLTVRTEQRPVVVRLTGMAIESERERERTEQKVSAF